MPSQAAKTETLLNIAGHTLTDGPTVPVLFVEPTEKLVREVSNDRFMKMVNSAPVLRDRMATGHANKVTEKFFAGVPVRFAWAGSATELASRPSGIVLVDEVDRMSEDVGGEGDPVTIVSARASTYGEDRCIVLASSPTVEGVSAIWKWFLDSTMMRWSWPCPNCDVPFVPTLATLKWPKDATPEIARDQCHIECPHCEHHIGEQDRRPLNARGLYVPHEMNDKGHMVRLDQPKGGSVAGFFVPGLASPLVKMGELAEDIVRAYRRHDQDVIKGVINTRFGEPFVMHGQRVTVDEIENLRGIYRRETIPDGCQMLTGGIDVQKNGLYYTVRGWGWLSESWLIDEGFLYGDTDMDSVWLLLSRVVQKTYGPVAVRRWLIDAGYRPGDPWRVNEHLVKKFVIRHPGQVSPAYGRQQLSNETIRRSEMTLDAHGQKHNTRIPQYLIDTDHFKQWLHSKFQHPVDQAGAFHLHADTPEAYIRHLVSEEMVVKPSGKRVWVVRTGFENHWFDCEVLARVAAVVENVEHLPQQAPMIKPKPPQPRRPSGNDWLAGYS